MKFILAFVALVHVVLSQDTSTTALPAFRDTNANGVNAGNMNGIANPGNLNPGNLNPGVNYNPNNADGMAVNNYPRGDVGNVGSTTVIPGVGINAAVGQQGVTAGNSVLGGGGGDSSSSEENDIDLPQVDVSSVGAAFEEGDSPDSPDNGAAVNAGGNFNNNGYGRRGDNDFNEPEDTPDKAANMVDADMGEQVGATSTAATAGILIAVIAVVAAAAGVGLYVVKQRRNRFSSSNV